MIAGMVQWLACLKADNGGWHKMAWYILFIALFLVLVTQCRFYCMFLFQLVMRKWTTSTPNVFCSYARVLDWYVVQLVYAWYRFSLQWLDFEACSKTGMFTIVWLCINWFVNSSLTMERNFSLETALVNVQWIENFICSCMDYDVHMNLFLLW